MDLTLSLTHRCNLACTYCYAGPVMARTMTWEVAERAIDIAVSKSTRLMQLAFFGGEPLLAWDLLTRAVEYARSRTDDAGLRLLPTITTNATLLTEERVRWLSDNGFRVAVSIDGNRAMHDATRPNHAGRSTFDAVRAGLERALRVYENLEIIAVVDPANVRHVADGVRFLADEVGVPRISLNPNFSGAWTEDDRAAWREGYQQVAAFYVERFRAGRPVDISFINSKIITRLKNGFECVDRCTFGEGELAVAPSGRVYPCERLIGDDTNDEMCIGDITQGLDDDRRRQLASGRGNSEPECVSCAVRERCMSWCGCINYSTTGNIDRPHALLCFHEKLTIEIADGVAATLFAEGNAAFFQKFYYTDVTAPAPCPTPAAPDPAHIST